MLKTTPLQDITVSSLSDRAALGRSTFYVYYDDVFSLYDEMIAEHMEPIAQIFEGENRKYTGSLGDAYNVICADKDFFRVMLASSEPYFEYKFRQMIVGGMRKMTNDVSFPGIVYAVFADRFINVVKSFIFQTRNFSGELLGYTINIWAKQYRHFSTEERQAAQREYNAIARRQHDVGTEYYRGYFGDKDSLENRIRNGFLKLLEDESYDKISVVEISRNAAVSRTTFYKYFSNGAELYENLCDGVMGLFQRIVQKCDGSYTDTMYEISAVIFESREIFRILLSESHSSVFRNRFIRLLTEVQMHYFGMSDEEVLHENIAKFWLDSYEIYSNTEMAFPEYEGIVIRSMCLATGETFAFAQDSRPLFHNN